MKSFFLLISENRDTLSASRKICSKRDYPSDKTNGLKNKKTETYRFLLFLALIMMQPLWSDLCYVTERMKVINNNKVNKNGLI